MFHVYQIQWCTNLPRFKHRYCISYVYCSDSFLGLCFSCQNINIYNFIFAFRKGIFDEYSQITSLVTEEIVNVHKEIQMSVEQIDPSTEYNNFIDVHRYGIFIPFKLFMKILFLIIEYLTNLRDNLIRAVYFIWIYLLFLKDCLKVGN